MLFKRLHLNDIVILATFVLIFVAASFFSNQYSEALKNLVLIQGAVGMVSYVFLLIVAEVIAPISFLPALPLAVTLWGSFAAAVLSITGWTIGAVIAYFLARRFGRGLVGKIVHLERIDEIGMAIPEKKLFWAVIFFRMIFPVDILSYALGLFTKMKPRPYTLATLIGISPFAFILSYGVSLPIKYQIVIGLLILLITVLIYKQARRRILAWIKK